MKPYDLHNHTSLSKDGKIPPKELIDLAISRGVKGLGICDHDEFPDESLYDYAKQKGLKLALGIEFSCRMAHIIGYNMNIQDADRAFLEQKFDELRKDYDNVSRQMIQLMQKSGIDITYEKIQKKYNKDTFSKLFIMKYFAEELGLAKSWSDSRKILKQKGLYIRDGQDVEQLEPSEAVDIIHRAGGFAIWAHPFITPQPLRHKYFKELLPRIDAIEVHYAYDQNGYPGDETNEQLETMVREEIKDMKTLVSGGSDSHFPLKTYSDLSPIYPGDFGISEEEYNQLFWIFH
jgi:3',5'-nucleoside bisphosphate phosphatase